MDGKTTDKAKYDEIVNLSEQISLAAKSPETEESRASVTKARERACFKVARAFPLFDDKDHSNDELLSPYFIEKFGEFRALGLSLTDVAYNLEISSIKLEELMQGKGLSFEKFAALVRSELFSRAQVKAALLVDVKDASGTKAWRTSLTLLEKLYPDEYAPKGGLESKIDDLVEHAWKVNIVEPNVPAVEGAPVD